MIAQMSRFRYVMCRLFDYSFAKLPYFVVDRANVLVKTAKTRLRTEVLTMSATTNTNRLRDSAI